MWNPWPSHSLSRKQSKSPLLRESFHTLSSRFLTWRILLCQYIPIISAAHLVYHDVLAELLSTESWSARLWAIKWCWVGQWAWRCLNIANMCLLLVANVTRSQQPHPSYRKRKSQTIISQDFLVSVGLAKWGLTRLGSPQFACFREAI